MVHRSVWGAMACLVLCISGVFMPSGYAASESGILSDAFTADLISIQSSFDAAETSLIFSGATEGTVTTAGGTYAAFGLDEAHLTVESLVVLREYNGTVNETRYSAATLAVSGGGNLPLMMLTNCTASVSVNAPAAVSAIAGSLIDDNGTSLLHAAPGTTMALAVDAEANETFLSVTNSTVSVIVNGTVVETITAVGDVLFGLSGTVSASVTALGTLIPLVSDAGAGTLSLTATMADAAAWNALYDDALALPESFDGAFDFGTFSFGDMALPESFSEIVDAAGDLRPMIPAANGIVALVNARGSAALDGGASQTLDESSVMVFRGDRVLIALVPAGEALAGTIDGSARFVFLNNALYSEFDGERSVFLYNFMVPQYAISFWLFAILVVVIMLFVSRTTGRQGAPAGSENDAQSGRHAHPLDRQLNLPLHIVEFIVFIAGIWVVDAEVARIFGISLVDNLSLLPSFLADIGAVFSDPLTALPALPFALGFLLTIIPYFMLIFFFAIPVTIIASSTLAIFNLRKVNVRIGTIAGITVGLFVGIDYITYFINMVLQAAMPLLASSL